MHKTHEWSFARGRYYLDLTQGGIEYPLRRGGLRLCNLGIETYGRYDEVVAQGTCR